MNTKCGFMVVVPCTYVRTYVANAFDPCTLEGITPLSIVVSVLCEAASGGGGSKSKWHDRMIYNKIRKKLMRRRGGRREVVGL